MGPGLAGCAGVQGWTPALTFSSLLPQSGYTCRLREPCAKKRPLRACDLCLFLNTSLSMLFSQFNYSLPNLPSPILHRDSTNDHVGSCQ
jgi:hypothetical protein